VQLARQLWLDNITPKIFAFQSVSPLTSPEIVAAAGPSTVIESQTQISAQPPQRTDEDSQQGSEVTKIQSQDSQVTKIDGLESQVTKNTSNVLNLHGVTNFLRIS
jgi:hypothetical protein